MASTHTLIIKSRAGERRGELGGVGKNGFLTLACTIRVNAPGVLQFVLDANNPAIDDLEMDGQVEYWRDDLLMLRGLYQGPHYETNNQNQETFTAICAGEKHLLSRAVVAWPAATVNRSLFTNAVAETIMYTLVKYNVTPEATVVNGRMLDNPQTHILLEDDLGRGIVIDKRENSGKALLDELQEIASIGGVDFDLVQTAAQAWTFRVYEGQLGQDRSADVFFSRLRGNMGSAVYDYVRTDEKNVIVVGGSGLDEDRVFAVRYGPDYSVAQHRETALSATSESGIVGLQAEGDKELDSIRIKPKLTFEAIQAARSRFAVDYFVGDLVAGSYRGVENGIFQVSGATITLSTGANEQIVVELVQR